MFPLLAAVSGAGEAAVREAIELSASLPPLPPEPLAAAWEIKRQLARVGFRDEPDAFTLDSMLARRAGNCLGLSLLVGAMLLARGIAVRFAISVNPRDAVHLDGEEHFARLCDPVEGVDCDSRLPEAGDCSSRFRFVAVEHASLRLGASGELGPFEATGLSSAGDDPAWAPEAESVRVLSFEELSATVLSERAKAIWSGPHGLDRLDEADALARRSVELWPANREGWAQCFRQATASRGDDRGRRERAFVERFLACGGDDSLFDFTAYQMTGERARLDRALERFPSFALAYFEKHVAAGGESGRVRGRDEAARHFAVAAWCHAESEIASLRRFYQDRRAIAEAIFGAAEIDAIMASFG